jgi:hypothetical protein
MIPKILEYDPTDFRISVTAEAFAIPELKVILDKHELQAEPYLMYVHLMTAPDSPYINLPIDEKAETVIYDVINSLGDFDPFDDLLKPAVAKLDSLYTSPLVRHYKGLKILLDKFTQYAIDKEIIEGKDGNMPELQRLLKEAGINMKSFKEIEKQVDEELKTKMKGKTQLGDYD